MSAYIRKIALEGKIIRVNAPEIRNISVLLGNIASKVKQMAQAVLLAQKNQLGSLESLRAKATEASSEYHEIQAAIQSKTLRMNEIAMLQKNIGTYRKTRDVYTEYQKKGYSKKFLTEHEEEIHRHQEAKKYFDNLNLERLPTISELKQEYAALLAKKKKLYQLHRPEREKMMEWRIAQYNIEKLLDKRLTGPADSSRSPTETQTEKHLSSQPVRKGLSAPAHRLQQTRSGLRG